MTLGYDDKPGTNRAKYCWKGNQMFADLDRELRFGYQKNGSLVVAFNDKDVEHLKQLQQRGETNGVERLRIVQQDELRKMEPHIHPDAVAALYSPDAGNVIPCTPCRVCRAIDALHLLCSSLLAPLVQRL